MTALIERPLWLDSVDLASLEISSNGLPASADVAVIGGGFTGLSAARSLARQGASVVVLEQHHIAWGASSRNGGMALTGLKVPAPALVARYGRERAGRLFAASLEAIDFVERIVREESIDCDFIRSGHAEVACKPGHFQGMRRDAEALGAIGHPVRLVERQGIGSIVDSEVYHGALVDDKSAGLNPARFAAGLAGAARRAGAHIAPRSRVDRIDRNARTGSVGFDLHTATGSIRTQAVLVATGAYSGPMSPAIARRVIPIGSYVIATDVLDEALATTIIQGGRQVFDSNHFLHYYKLTPDRRMLFGGRAAFFPADDKTTRASAEILARDLIRIFPQLRGARVAYAWGGTIDFTFDQLPHVGVLDGIYYALGYAGHGVAMATCFGDRVADMIRTGSSEETWFGAGPLPAPPPGLIGGPQWLLPFAGAWYRLLDWAS